MKIHNPPGGKSNFSFGFDDVPSYKQPALKQYDMNQGAYQEKPSYQQAKKDQYQNSVTNMPSKKYGGGSNDSS